MLREIREALHAEPFEPFTICLADGRSIRVTHPDAIAYLEQGPVSIYVSDPDSRSLKKVALRQITSIDFPPDAPDQSDTSEAA